jgi:glucose dehydrogenase
MRYLAGLLAVALFAAAPALGWEHWGGDRGGTRFSPLAQITPANVGNLVRAWEFRTGDLDTRAAAVMARTKFSGDPAFCRRQHHLLFALQRGHRARSRQRHAEVAIRSEDQHQSAAGKSLRLPRRRLLGR